MTGTSFNNPTFKMLPLPGSSGTTAAERGQDSFKSPGPDFGPGFSFQKSISLRIQVKVFETL